MTWFSLYSLAGVEMGAKGAQNIAEAIAVMPQLNSLKCATSLLELPPPNRD